MAEDSQLPTNYQKAKVISGIVASLLIPVAIGVTGFLVNYGIKENELRSRYVELAVSILKESPEAGTEGLRRWAIDVLADFSPVTLPVSARRELYLNSLSSVHQDMVDLLEP